MVDLVLDTGRHQPLAVHLHHLVVEVAITDAAGGRAFHLLIIIRDRQAAFLIGRQFVRNADDFRIDEHDRLLFLVLAGKIDHHHALGHRDLDGGKPDAGRVIHGLQHVLRQLADGRRDGSHRL